MTPVKIEFDNDDFLLTYIVIENNAFTIENILLSGKNHFKIKYLNDKGNLVEKNCTVLYDENGLIKGELS